MKLKKLSFKTWYWYLNNERYLLDEDKTSENDEFIEKYYFDILKYDIVVFESFKIKNN